MELLREIGRKTKEKMEEEIASRPRREMDLGFRNIDRDIMLGGIIASTTGFLIANPALARLGLGGMVAEGVTLGQLTRVVESTIEVIGDHIHRRP